MARRSLAEPKGRPRRQGAAEEKLHAALASLRQQEGTSPIGHNATVTELCRRAGVSRNALYRDYPQVLHDLRKLQCRVLRTSRAGGPADEPLRAQNALLTQRLGSLAALVDHYYVAFREASALLERRERELAEVRCRLKMKPAALNPSRARS